MKEENFMGKVKSGFSKFFKGVKNFIVKTGRVNGSNCYGVIDGIGDFLVYEDHALISAVGMDDVTFTRENVVSYSFLGLGDIRRNKSTVKYRIILDDNVVFPEKVREKNDVKNLTAIINVEKLRSNLLGSGVIEYGKSIRGVVPVENCDVYGEDNSFIIVLKLEKRVGDKVEKYQESLFYPFANISSITETKNKELAIKFNDEKILNFKPANDEAYNLVKELK